LRRAGRSRGRHPYTRARTLINNLAESRQIAWIDAPIWIPEGSVIELGPPNRDAIVIGVRLQLGPGDDAVILVDVRELDESGTTRGALRRRNPPNHAGFGLSRGVAPGKNRTCARGLGNRCSIH
jgi:hypothetical protein